MALKPCKAQALPPIQTPVDVACQKMLRRTASSKVMSTGSALATMVHRAWIGAAHILRGQNAPPRVIVRRFSLMLGSSCKTKRQARASFNGPRGIFIRKKRTTAPGPSEACAPQISTPAQAPRRRRSEGRGPHVRSLLGLFRAALLIFCLLGLRATCLKERLKSPHR